MHKRLSWVLVGLLAINFLYTLSGVLNFEIESVDVLGMWLFKAKAIFIEGGLPLETLTDPAFFLAHPQYPLLLSAVYAFIYVLMGQVWELPILLLYPLYYGAILGLAYKVFRGLQLTHLQSLLYVYLYSMISPLLGQAGRGHAGSADIVIVVLAWLLVRVLQTQTTRKYWQTLVVTVGVVWIASQIKLEGLFLAAVILQLKSPLNAKITAILMSVVPFLIWNIVVAYYAIPSDFTFVYTGISEIVARGWLVVVLTFQEMLNVRNWYFLWPLVAIAIVTARPHRNAFIRQLGWILLCTSLGYVAVYLSVTTNVEAHITSSIDRVLLQLTPWIFPVFAWYSQAHLATLTTQPYSDSRPKI